MISFYQSDLLPWGGNYHGYDGLANIFKKIEENVVSTDTIEQYIAAGDRIVAVGRSRGHIKANLREFDVSIVHGWTMCRGKVVRWEAYIDTPKMLSALRNI